MKHQLLGIVCIILLSVNGISQFTSKGQKTIGGSGNEFAGSLIKTPDGGFIVAGSSASNISGEKTQNNRCRCESSFNDASDYWIVKLDKSMNIQWDKTIGGKEDDHLSTIIPTTDGGYMLGGYSASPISGEKTEGRRGPKYSSDYWIVKLDVSGNIQWDKTIGGKDQDNLSAVLQIPDGGYILGGSSVSGISGEKTDSSRGGFDYWVVRIDNNGNVMWDKTIGGKSADILSNIIPIDNGFILGGTSSSNKSGDKRSAAIGQEDYWLVKMDINGNILWDKTIGGNGYDQLRGLEKTNDGGFILAGSSDSKNSGDKTQKGRGYRDYWVVKLDANAVIEWDRTIGGSGWDELNSLKQTADGGYILSGSSSSNFSGEKSENTRGNQGWDDFWVVKLNRNGNIAWDKTIGGNDMETGGYILEYAKDNYVIAGSSQSNISGEKSQKSRGKTDYWVVALRYDPAKIAIKETEQNNLVSCKTPSVVYPNPVRNTLHIQNKEKAIYTLTNQAAVPVLTQTINGKGEMNVSGLQAGIYYLKNNSTAEVQKIIVQ